jgi:hypothetical protein
MYNVHILNLEIDISNLELVMWIQKMLFETEN